MKHFRALFVLSGILLLSAQTASARGVRIHFGNREVLNKVAELPDTEQYQTDQGNYIDLATLHEEFNIAYILPLWIQKEPRLVGYCEEEDAYYELSDDELTSVLAENSLDSEKLNRLGFYTRYGGKLVAAALLVLLVRGTMSDKKKKVEPIEV